MAGKSSPKWRVWWIAAAVAAAVALICVTAILPRGRRAQFVPGQPLLKIDSPQFTDSQLGLQFTPPADWAMQSRSVESPTHHLPQRVVVKFKRLIPGASVAWIKVSVFDSTANSSTKTEPTPAEFLLARKLPEPDWKVTHPLERGITIAGQPAARITFGGPFETEGKGQNDFTSEIVAVRRGSQMFEFAGTFANADAEGKRQIHAAIDSITLR